MKFSIHRIAMVLLFGVTLLVAGCSERPAESLIRSAKGYLAKNENKAAIIELKTLLQKAPNTSEARFLLGTALLESGDAFSADIELRKALALNHPKAAVVPSLARAMVLQGQFQKLIAEFAGEDLVDAAATSDLKTSLAYAYARQGKSKEADAALVAALRAGPQSGRARVMQARFKTEARDFDGAISLLDAIVADSPANHEAWQLKGDLLYMVRHDTVGAIDCHRKALKIRNDLIASHASILSILFAQNDLAGAKTQLAELKAVAPTHFYAKYFEAELAALNRDFKTAKEIVQQLLRVAPENANVLQMAGAIELQAGSALQAQNFLGKALQIAPNVIATRRLLAQTYLRSGQSERALELLTPLLAPTEQPDAQTLTLAAQAYLLNGDAANAETFFARVAKLDPNDARSRTALALAQFSKGHSELAFSQLQEIAASDKGTMANMALVSTHLRGGDFDAALKAIDELERKQPSSAMAPNLRGRIQLIRKDTAAARQSFERALKADPLYFPATVSLAQMDLAEKKPEQARKRFEAVLAVDPKNVRALLAIAGLRADAGASASEVKGLLANAVRLNPTEVAPRLVLIDAHLRSNDLKSAMASAQDAVAARPDSPELLDALGGVQVRSGSLNQAISTFNKLADMRPRSPEPQLRLADTYVANKNIDAARESLKRALVIKPNLMAAQRGLIMLELAAGKPKEALVLARAVQRIPEREAVGLLLVGDIEASQKNWTAAATAYRAGLKLADTIELAIKLHAVLLSANQRSDADKFADGWVKAHPDNAAFLGYLGNAAVSRHEYEVAHDRYSEVARLLPGSPLALNNLAWIAHKLHKPEALSYAEKANSLLPEQPAIMDTLAIILGDRDQIDKAVELEQRAVTLQPEHHTYRLNLAKLYIKAGKKALAKNELDTLAKLGDQFAEQREVDRLRKLL